jgi:hypothetical protein
MVTWSFLFSVAVLDVVDGLVPLTIDFTNVEFTGIMVELYLMNKPSVFFQHGFCE